MTSQTNSRYGLMFAVAIAMTAGIAVTGSSWATGNGQQSAMASETAKIDVSALPGADIVLYIEEPF
jgi:hypothetical protein